MSKLARHRNVIRSLLAFVHHETGCKTHHRIGCTCKLAPMLDEANHCLHNFTPRSENRRAARRAERPA